VRIVVVSRDAGVDRPGSEVPDVSARLRAAVAAGHDVTVVCEAPPATRTAGVEYVPAPPPRADHRYIDALTAYADQVYDAVRALHSAARVDALEFVGDPAEAYTVIRARRLLGEFGGVRLTLADVPPTSASTAPGEAPSMLDDAVHQYSVAYCRRHAGDPGDIGAVPPSELPLVTVVVPVHDDGQYLAGTIGSALRCGYGPVQVVIVDDGSVESDTVRTLTDLAASGEITVLRRPHEGLAAARNAGIEAARGRYVVPLDADDLLPDGFLGPAVAALERHPGLGALSGTVRNFGMFDSVTTPVGYVPDVSLVVNTFARATAVFRADALRSVGGYDRTLPAYEDWDLYLRLHKAGWSVECAPMVGHLYRRHAESMTFRQSDGARVALMQRLLRTHADLLAGDRAVELLMTMVELWKHRYEPSASAAWRHREHPLVAGGTRPT
jgi:GT2 family glycosyltransferase